MKVLLLLGGIVVALVAVGVIHFQKNGDQLNITIDEAKLKQTTGKWIDEGEHFIDDARQTYNDRQSRSSGDDVDFESAVRTQSRRFAPSPSRR